MNDLFGLRKNTIDRINAVFQRHDRVEKVVLYGSRSMGNFRNGSDIDLTMFGKSLDLTLQFKIETELDDLLLPYKIDLSVFNHIKNKDLITHIDQRGTLFYEKSKGK